MGSLGIWYLVLAKPQLSFELSEVRRFSFLSFYDPQKWRYSKFLKHRDPHFQLSQGYRAKEGGQQLPLFMRGFCSSNALFSASLSFRMFIFHLKKQLCHMTFCNKSKCSLFNKSKWKLDLQRYKSIFEEWNLT